MTAILSITFPIFAVIALGYVFVLRGWFKAGDLRVLSGFVMNLAIPALLFNAVTSAGGAVFDPVYLGIYAAGSLATFGLAYLWFMGTGQGRTRAAVATLGTCISNSGYVGYPMLLLAFPAVAQQVFAMNVMVESFLMLPLCFLLLELDAPGGLARNVGRILWETVRRPMMIGLIAGMALTVAGISIPSPVSRLAALLGSATAPLALFYIGGSLAGLGLGGNRAVAAQIVAGKLVLHPAMVALAILALPLVGLPALDEALRGPAVLMAAVPMLGIYAIFAGEKGHQGMASIALLVGTVAAFFSLSALLAVLH